MTFIISFFIIVISCIILKDFKKGVFITIFLRFLVPDFVRFIIGPISLAIYDFLLIPLTISFILHFNNIKNISFPILLKQFLFLYYGVSFVLIFFATSVPIQVQMKEYFHYFWGSFPYILFSYYALCHGVNRNWFYSITFIFTLMGLYGIICYLFKTNPYIESLSVLYSGDYLFGSDMNVERGGLEGRFSGTANQVLTWGQYWIIALAFYLIIMEHIKHFVLNICVICIGCINIIICGSRTAIVSSFIIFLYLFLYLKRRRLLKAKKVIPVFIVFFLLFVVLLINTSIIQYVGAGLFFWDQSYSDSLGISGSSVEMRKSQLIESLDFMTSNFGGLGFGALSYFGTENIGENMFGFESIVFFEIFTQGICGLFSFFLSFYLLFKWFLSFYKGKTTKYLIIGYCLSYLVSIMMTGNQNTFLSFVLVPFILINRKDNSKNLNISNLK